MLSTSKIWRIEHVSISEKAFTKHKMINALLQDSRKVYSFDLKIILS